jgi:RNA polymerase sigma-B factor
MQLNNKFKEYRDNPSIKLRNELVEQNMGLVKKYANQVCNSFNNVEFDDLVQEGALALVRCVDKFDLTKGCTFSTYAAPHIKGQMYHYIRDKGFSIRPPRSHNDLINKSRKLRCYKPEEIAVELKVSVEEWLEAKQSHKPPQNLDHTISDDSNTRLMDTIVDDSDDMYSRVFVSNLLDQLPSHYGDVIYLTYYDELTQKEIGEVMGFSPMTVKRYQKKGMAELSKLVA